MSLGAVLAELASLQAQFHRELAGGMRAVAALRMPDALFALGTAFLLGAVHALMPGHGKATLMSYHAGRPGTPAEGLATGAILIATHVGTAIALVLAGVALFDPGGFGRDAGTARAPAFAALLVVAVGLWLLVAALRRGGHAHRGDGRMLAFATGLVPCPLTTLVMTFAAVNGIAAAGLVLALALAAGMWTTVAAFAAGAVLARRSLIAWFAASEGWRRHLGRALEIASAGAIVLLGLATLAAAL